MITDVLKVGDKVEIRVLQEVLRGYEVSDKMHIYRSKIFDITGEDEIVMAMPVEASKVILLPKEIRYDLSFFAEKGLYNCSAEVKGRYKEGNLYSVSMRLLSPLKKLQRRKFFRLDCLVDFSYFVLYDEEEKNLADPYAAHEYHLRRYPDDNRRTGVIVDISGGGIRTITTEQLPMDGEILAFFRVNMGGIELPFVTFAHVVKNKVLDTHPRRYESGLEYRRIDERIREAIVRYVFQEERNKRSNQKK